MELLDYVGFITKVLKLLQNGHNPEIRCIEMELNQLEELETAPQRPSKWSQIFTAIVTRQVEPPKSF